MKRACTALAAALALAACSPSAPPAATPSAPPATASPSAAAKAEPTLVPDAGGDRVSAVIEALAHSYEFIPAGEAEPTCMVRLDSVELQDDDAKPYRRAWIEPKCFKAFPVLQKLERWSPSGDAGASLDLLDGAGKEIGHFSPVQDTSVYLRGGMGGKIYEMRTPGE